MRPAVLPCVFAIAFACGVRFIAQAAEPAPDDGATMLPTIDIVEKRLDDARLQIQPSLGASSYNFAPEALRNQPKGRTRP